MNTVSLQEESRLHNVFKFYLDATLKFLPEHALDSHFGKLRKLRA